MQPVHFSPMTRSSLGKDRDCGQMKCQYMKSCACQQILQCSLSERTYIFHTDTSECLSRITWSFHRNVRGKVQDKVLREVWFSRFWGLDAPLKWSIYLFIHELQWSKQIGYNSEENKFLIAHLIYLYSHVTRELDYTLTILLHLLLKEVTYHASVKLLTSGETSKRPKSP